MRFAARIANAFGVVLLLVVLLYALASLLSYSGWSGVVLSAVTGTCVIVALVSADARPRLVACGASLSVVALVLVVISAAGGGSAASGAGVLIQAVLLTVVAAEVLGTVLTEHEVGFRTILGAISVYLILGLLFSFTTLTTTGYGNLVPAGQPGRMLSGLEMLIGQIFLVTLIAGLVSLWRPGGRARRN